MEQWACLESFLFHAADLLSDCEYTHLVHQVRLSLSRLLPTIMDPGSHTIVVWQRCQVESANL